MPPSLCGDKQTPRTHQAAPPRCRLPLVRQTAAGFRDFRHILPTRSDNARVPDFAFVGRHTLPQECCAAISVAASSNASLSGCCVVGSRSFVRTEPSRPSSFCAFDSLRR